MESALTGNAEVLLSGKDHGDIRLRGTNEEFKAVTKLDSVSSSLTTNARKLVEIFDDSVKNKLIKISKPRHSDRHLTHIRSVIKSHEKESADDDNNA